MSAQTFKVGHFRLVLVDMSINPTKRLNQIPEEKLTLYFAHGWHWGASPRFSNCPPNQTSPELGDFGLGIGRSEINV